MKLQQHPDHPHMICPEGNHHVILGQMHSVQIAERVVLASNMWELLFEGWMNLMDCPELDGGELSLETSRVVGKVQTELAKLRKP